MRVTNGKSKIGGVTKKSTVVGTGKSADTPPNRGNEYKGVSKETPLETEKSVDLSNTINSEKQKVVSTNVKYNKDINNVNKNSNTQGIRKLSAGRIVGMVFVGVISCLLLAGVLWGIYYNQIRYPEMAEYDVENSGFSAIQDWLGAINTLDNEEIKTIIGENSYLAKEVEYANGNEYKVDFISKMVGTVYYEPNEVVALDKYGNPLVDKNNKLVYMDSLVNDLGESLILHYIDYTKIPLNKDKIKSLLEEYGLQVGSVDYSNRLVEVFCRYMLSFEDRELPLVSVKYTPNLKNKDGVYTMSYEEDIYLDKVLFSSEEFYNLLDRFSVAAGAGVENPEWVNWNKLPDDEKSLASEPTRYFDELQPTGEWVAWSKKSSDEKKTSKEPRKYNNLDLMSNKWCGAYYLLNEYSEVDGDGNVINKQITADVGEGTLENPAGMNTGIVTYTFITEKNAEGEDIRVKYPVRVRLVDYRVSQDAIDYFEGCDDRNRGFDIKSEKQYVSYSFEVTNLSSKDLVIYENTALCDSLANQSPRTGEIYGLENCVTLKPHETGVVEGWGCSTELNKKYLIWGRNFNREIEPVWFRVLAGNIDDPSESKGVAINNSRYDTEEDN